MTDTMRDKVHIHLRHYYHDVLGHKDVEERIEKRFSRVRGKQVVSFLNSNGELEKKKLLEVGSGWGEICIEAAASGAYAIGIEPDPERVDIARWFSGSGTNVMFIQGTGEFLPFSSQTFDYVICHGVLEHVASIPGTLDEMIRVLKRGGILYLNTPNYLFPYEGHYEIVYPPLCPKQIAKYYLLLRGRNPSFIKNISYPTVPGVKRILKKYPVIVRNLFFEKQNSSLPQKKIKKMLRYIIRRLQLYWQIELLIQKK